MCGGGGAPGGSRMRFSTGGGCAFEDVLSGMFGGSGFLAPRGPRPGRDVNATTSLSCRDATQGDTVRMTSNGSPMTVRIPAGVRDGQKIRLRGKGAPGDAGAPAGDLVVTVQVQPHPVFSRSGKNDLRVTVPVTFAEAALGGEENVPTLSAENVRVKVPAGTASGRALRVRGRGAQVGDAAQAGDRRVAVAATFAEAALGGEVTVPALSRENVRVEVPAGTPSGRTLRARGRGVQVGNAAEAGELLVPVQIVVPQRLDEEAGEAVEG